MLEGWDEGKEEGCECGIQSTAHTVRPRGKIEDGSVRGYQRMKGMAQDGSLVLADFV